MSDFRAKITAELDTSDISKQLSKIENQKVKLSGITVDTSGIRTEIEKALKGSFKIKAEADTAAGSASSRARASTAAANKAVDKAISNYNTGAIEASIARVNRQFSQLSNTGNSKLSSIKGEIKVVEEAAENLGRAIASGNSDSIEKWANEVSASLKKVKSDLSIVSDESKQTVDSLKIMSFDNKVEQWMQDNTKAAKQYADALREIRQATSKGIASGGMSSADYEGYVKGFKTIDAEATAKGIKGNGLFSGWGKAFKEVSSYFTAYDAIQIAERGLKDMYNNVKNIDTAMVELRKVTDESEASYSKFLSNANKEAQQIGTTITDYVSSTADFSRLGYSFKESQNLSKVANIYSVVGDDISGIDVATEHIVSTLAAFGDTLKDPINVVDKFNEVGNKFAISSGGIGEAMERSSSSLKAANNTIDESVALITAAI